MIKVFLGVPPFPGRPIDYIESNVKGLWKLRAETGPDVCSKCLKSTVGMMNFLLRCNVCKVRRHRCESNLRHEVFVTLIILVSMPCAGRTYY